jgi:hypothetical protein
VETTSRDPWRVRFRVPLTVFPPLVGVGVAIPLWGTPAETEFFGAAAEVLALGAVGMALSGRFFRLSIHRGTGVGGVYAIINILSVLVAVGVGLAFAFDALAEGHATDEDLPLVAGALATGISAFAVQALFGTPGLREEEHSPEPPP